MSSSPRSTEEVVLDAQGLVKHYPVSQGFMKPKAIARALDGVSFTLQRGKTLAVVGESGCGKSTLARQNTMIEPPTAGHLHLTGVDVATADAATKKALRQQVQMVFQNPFASLNPRKKIGHALEEPLLITTTLTKAERQTRQVLSGELPSPLNPPSGCAFHKRCPYAVERCTVDVPLLRQPTDGKTIGLVACHFAEEIATRTANQALGTAA
jgi:oligopeptide/dipeptide ABC transporter ATP-binding protein